MGKVCIFDKNSNAVIVSIKIDISKIYISIYKLIHLVNLFNLNFILKNDNLSCAGCSSIEEYGHISITQL